MHSRHYSLIALLALCVSILFGVSTALAITGFGAVRVGRLYNYLAGVGESVVNGDYVYMATGASGLQILDFTDHDNVTATMDLEENVDGVIMQNGVLYARCYPGFRYLVTLDINDPLHPVVVDTVLSRWGEEYYGPIIQDTVMFFGRNRTEGLVYYSLADPLHPTRLPPSHLTQDASEILLSGQRMFTVRSVDDLHEWDFSDPYHLHETARYNYDLGPITGIRLSGNRLFSVCGGVLEFDVSNPDTIICVDSLEFHSGTYDWAFMDDVGYMRGEGVVRVLDLRTPHSLQLGADVQTDTYFYPRSISLGEGSFCVSGNPLRYEYLPRWEIERFLIDDPLQPAFGGKFETAGKITGIASMGRYIYVAADILGIRVVDADDPANPVEVDTIAVGNRPTTVSVVDGKLMVIDYDLRHWFFDLTNPESPELLGHITWNDAIKPVGFRGAAFFGIADQDVLIFDLSDFQHPRLINNYYENIDPIDAKLQDDRIILSDRNRGLMILDVSDVANIRQIEIDDNQTTSDLFVSGNIVIVEVTEPESALKFINVSDPAQPVVLASIQLYGVISADFQNSLLLYDGSYSAGIIDFSDLAHPQVVARYSTTSHSTYSAFLNGDFVAFATESNLSICDISSRRRMPRWVETPSASLEVTELDTIRLHFVARDPGGRMITLSLDRGRLPEAAHFTDNGDGSGDLFWVPVIGDYAYYQIECIADNGEAPTRHYISVMVNRLPVPPRFTDFPRDTTFIDPGDTLNLVIHGEDPHNGTISYGINYIHRPRRFNFSTPYDGTCKINWTPTRADTGFYDAWIRITAWNISDSALLRINVGPRLGVERDPSLPTEFALDSPYPNPFNGIMNLNYGLPQKAKIRLSVFDLAGREIAVLVSGEQPAGSYQLTWNSENFASGLYFVRLDAGAFQSTWKATLLR